MAKGKESDGPNPNLVPRSQALFEQRYVNIWKNWMGTFPKGPQILGLVFQRHLRVFWEDGDLAKVNAAVHRLVMPPLPGPPHVVVHVVNYHTQKGANHILVYLNGTFLSGALHKAWLHVAALPKCSPARLTFMIPDASSPYGGTQDLCKTSMTHLPQCPLSSISPCMSTTSAATCFMCSFQAEKEGSFLLSSLTQIRYSLICVNPLNVKSLEVMLYIWFVSLQSWSSHQHTPPHPSPSQTSTSNLQAP